MDGNDKPGAQNARKIIPFEPVIAAQAVLGVALNAKDGSVVLALQTARHPRIEIAMSCELAEVVLASVAHALQLADQSPAAP